MKTSFKDSLLCIFIYVMLYWSPPVIKQQHGAVLPERKQGYSSSGVWCCQTGRLCRCAQLKSAVPGLLSDVQNLPRVQRPLLTSTWMSQFKINLNTQRMALEKYFVCDMALKISWHPIPLESLFEIQKICEQAWWGESEYIQPSYTALPQFYLSERAFSLEQNFHYVNLKKWTSLM